MIKPVKMAKISIVGPRDQLEVVSETLHRMNVVHIEDPVEEEYFRIGEPLEKASVLTRNLVQLRSFISHLGLDPDKFVPGRKYRVDELTEKLDEKLKEYQEEIGTKIEESRSLAERERALRAEMANIEPLKELGIPPRLLKDYKEIRVFVGTLNVDPTERLREITDKFEIVLKTTKKEIIGAIFVKAEYGEEFFKVLQECGYKEIPVPDIEDYDARLREINSEIEQIKSREKSLESEIEEIKAKEAEMMMALEEYLTIEADKSELPLRALVSKYAFVIAGYIPEKQYQKVKSEIESKTNGQITVERLNGEEEESEPPTLLKNPPIVRDIELFTTTYATPKYGEIDPSLFMTIFFPLFFGLMLGDVGYGLLIAIMFLAIKFMFKTEGWQKFANIGIYSGIAGIVFGIIYGEFFGPIYVPGMEYSAHFLGGWAQHWGEHGFHPIFDRVEAIGVKVLLLVVLVIGMFKMLFGFALGFYNVAREHGIKEAILEKGSWFLGVLALSLAIFGFVYNLGALHEMYEFTLHHYGVGIGLAEAPPPGAEDVPLPIPGLVDGWQAGVNPFYIAALPLVVIWFILFIIAEVPKMGAFGVIMAVELLTWFGQIISFARLLAIGLSSVYIAFVINFLALKIGWEPGMAILPLAIVIMVMGHAVNLILGILDPGLQSLRLHYVEFFTKFFEGGGKPYTPFGKKKKFVVD